MYFKINAGYLPKATNVGRVNYQKPWKHFSRITDEYVIFIINNGELFIEENGVKYHLTKGDFLMMEPNKIHVGYKESPCEYYYYHFKSNKVEKLEDNEDTKSIICKEHSTYFYDDNEFEDYSLFIPKYYKFKDLNIYHNFTNHIESAINDHFSYRHHYPVVVSSILVELLTIMNRLILSEIDDKNTNYISKTFFTAQKLKQFIEANVYRNISKDEIVDLFEFNYDYLNRLFNRYHGCSIHQYMLLNKIETAKTILSNNDIKISDVGYLVGIDNPYYFSKLFKKIVGVSPIEFYKSVRIVKESIEN